MGRETSARACPPRQGAKAMTHERCCEQDLSRQRKRRVTTLLMLLASTLSASRVAGQTGQLSDEKQAKIETAVSTFMASQLGAPGLSVAVVQDGEFVWSAGFG